MSERFNSEFNESSDPLEHEKSLDEIDLSGLIDSIEEYNKQFNAGTMLANIIISTTEGGGGISEEDTQDSKAKALVALEQKHREELGRTGLGLEHVKAFLGGNIGASEMRVNLSDGKKFTDYLDALNKSSLTEQQKKGLVAVADSLTKQLIHQYDLSNPDDIRMIELFGNLSKVVEGYQKLNKKGKNGVGDSVEQLEKYLEIARGKYLKEYLLAEKSGFLENSIIGVFGPKDWHGDSSPESYKEYWNGAIKKVIEIGKNKNAASLQKEIVTNLKKFLVRAKKDLRPMFEERLNQQEKDETDPNVLIFKKLSKEDVEKEIEEYKIVMDEMYEELENLGK